MRVLVCGGRDYKNTKHVFAVLDEIRERKDIHVIIHGAARGADDIAETWAQSRQVSYQGFPAKWDKFGSAAGPIRNALMIEDANPDLVVAFPGGKGTDNMIAVAKYAGIEVIEAKP